MIFFERSLSQIDHPKHDYPNCGVLLLSSKNNPEGFGSRLAEYTPMLHKKGCNNGVQIDFSRAKQEHG
jgi:hypothetical protein